MKSVIAENQRFNLQELLEFFRPHTFKLGDEAESNVVALKLGNYVKELSAPEVDCRRERTVRHVKQTDHSDIETLAAIYRGDDVIVGGLLHSKHCTTRPPFLVRKQGVHSSAGRFHYEVWACVESAPSDPMILLELCASIEAIGENIGATPKLLKIAVLNGAVYDFDTSALILMYQKIKEAFLESRPVSTSRKVRVTDIRTFQSNRCRDFK